MATKLDKETLIKHRFWFLLPVVVLLWLFAFISISSVSDATEKNWKEAQGVNDQLKRLPSEDLKNQRWIDAMKKEKDKAQDQKLDLWYEVFDKQNGVVRDKPAEPASADGPKPRGKAAVVRESLITWPRSPRNEIADMVAGKDFGAPLGNVPNEYKDAEIFLKQYEDIVRIVDPLNETKGGGAVRFGTQGNSVIEKAMALLRPPGWGDKPVLSEEAWLAQEEFAIKRDLFHIVRDINGVLGDLTPEWREVGLPVALVAPVDPAAAAITPPPVEEAKPQDAVKTLDRKRFLNTSWQFGVKEIKDPETNWFAGWLLELELTAKDKQVILEGSSTNLSQVNALPPSVVAVVLSNDDPRTPREYLIPVEAGKLQVTTPDPDRKDPAKKLAQQPTLELFAKYAREIKDFKASSRSIQVDLAEAAKAYKVPVSVFKKIERVQLLPPEGALDAQRYTNDNWIVEVQLVPRNDQAGQVRGLVHNKSGRRVLPVNFRVLTADVRRQQFAVEVKLPQGTAFDANSSKDFPLQLVQEGQGSPVRIAGVQQVLDWRTVPVKQIDRIEMGLAAHLPSDRTASKFTLKAYNFALKGGAADAAAAPAPTQPAGPGDTGTPDGQGAGAASNLPSGLTSNHGIAKARYAEITRELRRVPVAMVLIVEQAHINDAILAFSNSKLRIQTTMVVWNRVPGLPRPAFLSAGAEKPSPTTPVVPGARATGPIAEESNLVELQLFGLATVYEDPDKAQGGQTPPVAGR